MKTRLYTLEEEIGNTITHTIGSLFCAFLFGMFTYATFGCDPTSLAKDIGCFVFGFSSMFVFISSSLYHAISHIPSKRLLKLLDHIAIYFLIAGTYVPLVLVSVIPTHPIIGWSFLIIQVLSVIGGILFKCLSNNNYSIVSVLIYCLLGWSAIFILMPLIENLPLIAIYWLIAGGLAYTAGVPFYVLKQYKWFHTIWHVFVVLGVICHYMMMFNI